MQNVIILDNPPFLHCIFLVTSWWWLCRKALKNAKMHRIEYYSLLTAAARGKSKCCLWVERRACFSAVQLAFYGKVINLLKPYRACILVLFLCWSTTCSFMYPIPFSRQAGNTSSITFSLLYFSFLISVKLKLRLKRSDMTIGIVLDISFNWID